MVVGRAIVELVDGVVDIAVVGVVVHAGAYAYRVAERTGDYGLIIARGIGAEFDSRLILPGAGGVLGHVLDGPADIGATKQGAHRALQYLDAFYVNRPCDLPFKNLHVVDVKADTRDEAKAADAPQHHIRRVIVRLVDIEIRHQRAQVVELSDVCVLDSRGRNGGDRRRDVPEILGTFSCRDDNFNETVVLRDAGRSGLLVGSQGHGSVESAGQSQCQSSQTYPYPNPETSPG